MEQYPPDGTASPPPAAAVLRDFGSHLADQALQLFGPAAAVYAETHVTAGGFDDGFSLSLRHAGGVVSHLRGDWALTARPGRGSG